MRREYMGIPFVVDDGLPSNCIVLAGEWKRGPGTTDGSVFKQVVMWSNGIIEEYEIRAKSQCAAHKRGEG